MAYPRYRAARAHKFARRMSTSVTITTTTTFTNVDTALDLTLAAQVGDVIEYGLSGRWSNQATEGYLDVATIVSGARVNYLSGVTAGEATNLGCQCWLGDSSARANLGGSVMYTLVAGDLSAGTVTLRLIAKVTGSKDLLALPVTPLQVWAKNLGPADPN